MRAKFNDISYIETISAKRRLLSLGKIIRMPYKCIPARLITTFLENKRPIGKPKMTSRYSFLNDLKESFRMLASMVLCTLGVTFLLMNCDKLF